MTSPTPTLLVLAYDAPLPPGVADDTVVLRRAPVAQPPVVAETFTGANGAPWPAAFTTSGPGSFTVQSNTGRVVTAAAAYSGHLAVRGETIPDNAECLLRWRTTGATERYFEVRSRRAASGSPLASYGVVCAVASGALQIARFSGDTATVLATVTVGYTANTWYRLRHRWLGNTLAVKLWPDGTTEPAAWTLTATDGAITSGPRFALRFNSGNSATSVTFDVDDLTVTPL
jgi:hypothetical protein